MKHLLVCIPILFSINALSQVDLLSKEGSKYYYIGNKYNYKELDFIYELHQPALELYLSGRQLRIHAKKSGLIGLGLWIGGVTLIVTGAESPRSSWYPNEFASFATFSLMGSFILEIIALVQRIKGGKKLKRAKNIFNYHMIEKHGYQSDNSFSFGITKNGLGFIYEI